LSRIPVEFQKLDKGDHYFRSVFMSVKGTAELVALHEYIMAALERDGASFSTSFSTCPCAISQMRTEMLSGRGLLMN
jgi:hypothetical protein